MRKILISKEVLEEMLEKMFDLSKDLFNNQEQKSDESNDGQLTIDFDEQKVEQGPIKLNMETYANILGWPESIVRAATERVNPTLVTPGILMDLFIGIGVYMDSFYEDHIRDSEELYTFNFITKRIELVKGHQNIIRFAFPAFRSMEDARFACHFLKNAIKAVYK